MGKTPGKWIKNLLLGKKSSKSTLSKGKEKSTNKGEAVISSKVSVSELTVDPPLISPPLVGTGAGNEVDSEIGVAPKLPNDVVVSSAKEDETEAIFSSSQEDPERIKQEKAATKAQCAYRGYVARRAFQTLKGIIRLQALIRGHLVRRQAVSTLFCVQGIVKFQALLRGQRVRHSDIGIEVHKIHLDAKCFDISGVRTSSQVERLSKIVFVQKLLASLPTAIPLRLQYGPGEPNSSGEWLERWTRSYFWEPVLQPKKNLDPRSRRSHKKAQTIETEKGRPKRSVRRLSGATVENVSNRVTPDSEKAKRNLRKVPSPSVISVQEHQQNEVEKVKSNSKKISDTKEVSDRPEVDKERPKHSATNGLAPAAPDDSEPGTSDLSEKMKHVTVAVSKHSNLERSLELSSTEEPMEKPHDHPFVDMQPLENSVANDEVQAINQELNSKDNFISNENQKTSQRRASLPVKFDHQENGVHNTPRVPSYMAPTKSAKAKLRGQGSPRFAQDMVEKNVITRRHSLSTSTNSKLSSLSPRAQRLVQATGKGVIRSDKSLSSSRDGFDKVIQPEWRR